MSFIKVKNNQLYIDRIIDVVFHKHVQGMQKLQPINGIQINQRKLLSFGLTLFLIYSYVSCLIRESALKLQICWIRRKLNFAFVRLLLTTSTSCGIVCIQFLVENATWSQKY